MGSIGALKAWRILQNVQTVIAIELMVAAQGIDFSRVHPTARRRMKPGQGVAAAHTMLRKHISHLGADRVLYDDIQTALRMVKDGSILKAVEQSVGKLG